MHIIEDKICFEKKDDLIIGQDYKLVVDDITIEQRASKFTSSLFNFKKSVLPNLTKIGFDRVTENVDSITITRLRQNLNENIEITDFLNNLKII